MKKLIASVATLGALAGFAVAGPVVDKNVVVDPTCQCFNAGWGVGVFASGLLNGPQEDALGGGVELSYFFNKNFGVLYSYSAHATDSEEHVNALDLVYRMPLGNSCWAPYLIGGGALFSDGSNQGAYRAGAGIEYRLASCSAIFADGTYNWIATLDDAVQVRLGYRFAF